MNLEKSFCISNNYNIVDNGEEIYFFPIVNTVIEIASMFCVRNEISMNIIRKIEEKSKLNDIILSQYNQFNASYEEISLDVYDFIDKLLKSRIIIEYEN